jgi:hypothetical protein
MVHFHFTLSLRAHQLQNWISISMVRPLDDFPRPLVVHGHDFWSLCEAALSLDSLEFGLRKTMECAIHIVDENICEPGTDCAPHNSEVSAGTHTLAEIHD